MVDELKIYTVEWFVKMWGTEEVVAKNEKEAKEIIINRIKNMRVYDSEKGCINVSRIKEEQNKIEIVKTC